MIKLQKSQLMLTGFNTFDYAFIAQRILVDFARLLL